MQQHGVLGASTSSFMGQSRAYEVISRAFKNIRGKY